MISLLAVSAISSCSSKAPKPPVIEFGIHDLPKSQMLCARTNQTKCDPIPMAKTDNYIMLHPAYWEMTQNYIDNLICVIDGGCSASVLSQDSSSTREWIENVDPLEEAKLFSRKMKRVYSTLRTLRKNSK